MWWYVMSQLMYCVLSLMLQYAARCRAIVAAPDFIRAGNCVQLMMTSSELTQLPALEVEIPLMHVLPSESSHTFGICPRKLRRQ